MWPLPPGDVPMTSAGDSLSQKQGWGDSGRRGDQPGRLSAAGPGSRAAQTSCLFLRPQTLGPCSPGPSSPRSTSQPPQCVNLEDALWCFLRWEHCFQSNHLCETEVSSLVRNSPQPLTSNPRLRGTWNKKPPHWQPSLTNHLVRCPKTLQRQQVTQSSLGFSLRVNREPLVSPSHLAVPTPRRDAVCLVSRARGVGLSGPCDRSCREDDGQPSPKDEVTGYYCPVVTAVTYVSGCTAAAFQQEADKPC